MLYTRHVHFGDSLETALDRPRWLLGRTWGSAFMALRLENRFDPKLIDRLMDARHDVQVIDEAYSDTMGHAGAVVLLPDRRMEGAHDPRADGGAAGL
jgi:gamma-glutamyltranspeptidase/glutathione hydrolase